MAGGDPPRSCGSLDLLSSVSHALAAYLAS